MAETGAIDYGLLSPVSASISAGLSDAVFAACLVTGEVALARSLALAGIAPSESSDLISKSLGWRGRGQIIDLYDGFPLQQLVSDAVAGGNPVIPLVPLLQSRVGAEHAQWVHRGATSQDIFDSALMLFSAAAVHNLIQMLDDSIAELLAIAQQQMHVVTVSRTLTQQAVPTTVGLRFAQWATVLHRAKQKLCEVSKQLPAQLGGAGGTVAAFVELSDQATALKVRQLFADELGLAHLAAPWHVVRWPVTELGDALTQTVDGLGAFANNVLQLTRAEVAEIALAEGGGSSAMPQKQNPTEAVLIKSAAIKAPHIGAALHAAAAAYVDERPDGAWHAEWAALRELFRLSLGAAAHAVNLSRKLIVDGEGVAKNVRLSHGLILAERINIALTPIIGTARVQKIFEASGAAQNDLRYLLEQALGSEVVNFDLDDLLDPAHYTGAAAALCQTLITAILDSDLSKQEPK